MSVYHYPVIQEWIPGLPSISYRNGVGAYEGVVMHQTCCPQDTAEEEHNYEAAHWQDAFVHEFIDPNQVVQVANPSYIAYGAGPAANARFIHLELCHADDQEGFDKSFDAWCERAAEYLYARQLGVSPAQADGTGTLWAHVDVTNYLGGTNHDDPIAYLQQWGKSWQDVIDRVTELYNAIVEENKPAPEPVPEEAKPVEIQQWQKDAIDWLKEQGLIEQDHDPNVAVTWAELGVILQRALKKGE